MSGSESVSGSGRNFAVISAAGIGTRVKADRPKQYLLLKNKPVLTRVVDLFSAHPQIEKVVVVLHAKDHWWPQLQLAHPEKVLTAIGGKERVHSVLFGLELLKEYADKDDFILVHDAARPCLTSQNITDLLSEVKNHPLGGLFGLPVVDTLKRVDKDDTVIETVSREQLWRAQTPQCFRYQVLKSSIEKALSDEQVVTDESSALEYAGYHPKMILGDARNIKITFPEDLVIAQQNLE